MTARRYARVAQCWQNPRRSGWPEASSDEVGQVWNGGLVWDGEPSAQVVPERHSELLAGFHQVLSGLAPARIVCALERAATSRYAASRMASTVMVRRRNWESAASGGNVLVMTRARAEEVAEFIVGPAEPSG